MEESARLWELFQAQFQREKIYAVAKMLVVDNVAVMYDLTLLYLQISGNLTS